MELLTVEEAAKMLKLSSYTVRRLLREGKLAGVRLGEGRSAHWRIRKDALEAYLTRAADE